MKRIFDKAWWYNKESVSKYDRGLKLSSLYIEMRDGVKIATDIYLPGNISPGEKIPAIFHQTRATRRYALRWPFNYFIERSSRYFYKSRIKKLLNNGYALVNIDQRGSGASFGTRTREWSENDINDAYEVLDYIVKQPWCDGKTILYGNGYSAVAAELLLTKHHPSVKAAVFASSAFDIYTDLICPGGVKNDKFLYYWAFFNYYRDIEEIPSLIPEIRRLFLMLVTKGTASASKSWKLRSQLRHCVKEERIQTITYDQIKNLTFRDDQILSGAINTSSPHFYLKELNTSNVPICSISGWFDGAYSLGAIKRFMNVQTKGSRLVLGGWSNNRYMSLMPFPSRRRDSNFDPIAESIRFMNYHVKNIDNGIGSEERVHYFTMAKNAWQSSYSWPPIDIAFHNFYLRNNNIVILNSPSKISGDDKIKFNYRTTSGSYSRWESLIQADCHTVAYNSSEEHDDLSLIYATPPFEEDFEITGTAVISLYIKSNIPDIQIFVYLADMLTTGNMAYITEGLFRTVHKNINNLQAPYEVPYPTHSFARKDASFLSPTQENLVTFNLLPVSYLIKKSQSLRIRITGSDKDNFEIIGPAPEISICHGLDAPSLIKIPGRYIKN